MSEGINSSKNDSANPATAIIGARGLIFDNASMILWAVSKANYVILISLAKFLRAFKDFLALSMS